jgi:hypothetical protein
VNDIEEGVAAASLLCPFCLHQPGHVLLRFLPEAAEALCACGRCDLQWSTALDADEALALRHAPPRGLWIQQLDC